MNSVNLIILLSAISLLPVLAVVCTSFLKISIVLMFVRESLSLQQIPSNAVIYAMSLILSMYTMGPVYNEINNQINKLQYQEATSDGSNIKSFADSISNVSAPIKTFMLKNTTETDRKYFMNMLIKIWKQSDTPTDIKSDDIIVLAPAFMVSQLNDAFKVGFLLYLPSLIIDLFVSNLLVALGMMMMSPTTVSIPIKLLLFILVGGWSRVINMLLNGFM